MSRHELARWPHATVNGVRLYYEEHGSGAPILCIHGTRQLGARLGAAIRTWRGSAA